MGWSIVVSPYSYSESDGDEVYLGVVIAIVDKAAGKIVASLDDKKISVIDGVYPTSIYIDTAKYEISSGEVSFGVRFSQRAMSSVAQFQETFVNLYLVSQEAVASVGRGIRTSFYNGEGDGNCVFEGIEKDATIAVSAFSTSGKKDLVMTTRSRSLSSVMKGGGCVSSRSTVGVVRDILKFNGGQYEIPKGVKSPLAL
ncbi:hypothetical protein P3W53_29155 [Pseudomonas denitrificans (nom. rej.)]|nr:hypothetical protein [Pseudomonas denitrificans (nom. rej.)]